VRHGPSLEATRYGNLVRPAGRRGKIKVGPDKESAEFLANKINVEDAKRIAGLIPKDDPSLLEKPSIETLEDFFNY
jgi:hypothetical protein